MKNLGVQLSDDGKTEWRNNGGCIERKALYAQTPQWENVTSSTTTPTTPAELKAFCKAGNFGYEPPRTKEEKPC